ncbi:putative cytochrome P450 142 [Mycobacterium noviomagense]|nr:putative cytochrome P450 142 [Mycobacterium noviomagense]
MSRCAASAATENIALCTSALRMRTGMVNTVPAMVCCEADMTLTVVGRVAMTEAIAVPDVDLTDGTFYASGGARAAYRWMRTNQPVFRDRNGLAAASTYQAIIDAERNPELFSNTGGIRPDQDALPMMIDMDDPPHLLRRKLVNAGFTRKQVKDKERSIAELCDTLIDAVCERGECDFVRDLAAPLPMAVIGDMLGVRPEQRDMFLKWSDDLVAFLSSHVSQEDFQVTMDAFAAYNEFTRATIAARRQEPTEDLVSVLVSSEVDGERLSDDELVMETLLILIGGDETTRHTLSGGTEQLLRNRDQWEMLQRDPDQLLPSAIEEMLRWTSPVKNMCRTLTADTEFHGTQLYKGEKMMLLFESANFDEAEFDEPERFDITRNPNSHLAFGFGTHFCLGNQLARLELTLMTRRIVERLPDLRLASDDRLPLRPANFVSGLESMPVVFTPTAPRRRS